MLKAKNKIICIGVLLVFLATIFTEAYLPNYKKIAEIIMLINCLAAIYAPVYLYKQEIKRYD